MTIYSKKTEVKDVMTIAETANYLNTSFQSVKQLITSGEIPYRKLGRRYFIAKEMVDRWLRGEPAE